MRRIATFLIAMPMVIACLAAAADLGRQAPARPAASGKAPPPDPRVIRQGGDTLLDAVPIPIPYTGSGSTTGYADDYDEMCPFTGMAPDVVYEVTPAAAMQVTIDLCGSQYDTKVYAYGADMSLLGCNDDHYAGAPCGQYVSLLEGVHLAGGEPSYIVVDGYGPESGTYEIAVTEFQPCDLPIPADALAEGEPPLVPEYEDCHNNGCSGPCPDSTWQLLPGDQAGELVFHGRSGWYPAQVGSLRDTDWLEIVLGPLGVAEITVDAEAPLYLFELGPQECSEVGVLQNVQGGACQPATLTVTGEPGATVWIWTGPTTFEPPPWLDPDGDFVAEFSYVLWLSGLESGPVAVETRTLGQVRALYR